jgi:hypothetical protein
VNSASACAPRPALIRGCASRPCVPAACRDARHSSARRRGPRALPRASHAVPAQARYGRRS